MTTKNSCVAVLLEATTERPLMSPSDARMTRSSRRSNESTNLWHFRARRHVSGAATACQGYEVFGTSRDAQVGVFANLARLGIRDAVRLESMAPTTFGAS